MVIWTDGITQWTYDKTKDELTIESKKPEVKESSSESNSDLDMFDGILPRAGCHISARRLHN